MRKACDYFENTRRAIEIQREYAERNPHEFTGYAEHCWGLTACDGPGKRQAAGMLGYAARGVPYGPDDGTLAGWAAVACVPFAPDVVLVAAREMCRQASRNASRREIRQQFQSDTG